MLAAVSGAALQLVELPQDLDGLPAQLPIDGPPVLARELAHAVVELGVADLAVPGLLGGAERLDAGGLLALRSGVLAQRTAYADGNEEGQRYQRDRVLHAPEPRSGACQLPPHAGRVQRSHA